MDQELQKLTDMQKSYIKSLTEREYKAYMIAKSHLDSSFDLEKSIGYKEWKRIQKETASSSV